MTSPAPAADSDGNAPVEALETAFRRITQIVKRSAREFAVAMHPELRPAGWIVLVTVLRGNSERGPVAVGEIIAETEMDKSVVSRLLRSLADWGLVTMSRSESDARVIVVEGTAVARERLAEIRRRQRERYAKLLADWSGEDVRRLGELLNRVSDALNEGAPASLETTAAR